MGSSDSGGGGGLGDSGAGTIVWVRRRNGSWWPGKILGSEELSASHLMSPRSGTPVKLLGREDASVDWYNLEKSKRVKAFRCGEFDDCIEKAEAAIGTRPRKREKYARREDAILHALELEKQFLDQKYVNLGTASHSRYPISSDSGRRDLSTSSGTLDDVDGDRRRHDFHEGNLRSESSNKNVYRSIPVTVDEGDVNLNMEYDSLEVNPRRSARIDYGHRKASTKQTSSLYPASNGSRKATVDPHSLAFPDGSLFTGKYNDVESPRVVKHKKKRQLEVPLEESMTKRRDRRRPLARVLENSELHDHSLQPDFDARFPTSQEHSGHDFHIKRSRSVYLPTDLNHLPDTNGVYHDQLVMPVSSRGESNLCPHSSTFSGKSSSESSEETESDSAGAGIMEREIDPELTTYSDANVKGQALSQNSMAFQGQHESTSSEEHDISSPGEPLQYRFHDPVLASLEVSKWQLKGKRNIRQLPRRSIDSSTHAMYLEGIRKSLTQRRHGPSLSYYNDIDDFTNEVDLLEGDIKPHEEGFGNRRYLPNLQTAFSRQSIPRQQLIDWEEITSGDGPFKGYLDERGGFLNPSYVAGPMHDNLIDVDVKVEAKQTRGEHVPWVSLMSKLNGRAIIGHPIQIETLDDASTDILLSAADLSGASGYNSGNSGQTVWTTARRSANVRVPRPHLSAMPDDDEDYSLYIDHHKTPQFKKPAGGGSANNKSSVKKAVSHVPKPPQQQRVKKQNKKWCSSASQKTRTLSSMGINQMKRDEYYMDGVIKPLASGPPTVSCIPVKLVFSRLLEAVGRPPSGLPSHAHSVISNKERNPS